MRRAGWILLIAVGCVSLKRPVPPPLWGGLSAGPHHVGFFTRDLETPPHRLQVSVWYPAEGGGQTRTWRDLFLLTLTERNAGQRSESEKDLEVRQYVDQIVSDGVKAAAAEELLRQRLLARAGARMARGKYPLILIAQGNGQAAVHQSVLAEFIASQGYVVATVPSITRLTGAMTSEADLLTKVNAEADDLQRAWGMAAKLTNVDGSRVGIIGYSLGSRSALLVAIRQPVAAIVSLDGGIGTARGAHIIPRPERPLPPILHLYGIRDDRMQSDFTFLRGLPAAALRLEKLESLQHTHFSSIGFAAALIPDIASATKAGENVRVEVRLLAETVLRFLDEEVRRREA